MNWTLAKAKDHLSEVVKRATSQGPQTISVRGQDTAVLISKADFDALSRPGRPTDFKVWLSSLPPLDELDLDRDRSVARDFEL
jgi:antitoxin Phd